MEFGFDMMMTGFAFIGLGVAVISFIGFVVTWMVLRRHKRRQKEFMEWVRERAKYHDVPMVEIGVANGKIRIRGIVKVHGKRPEDTLH